MNVVLSSFQWLVVDDGVLQVWWRSSAAVVVDFLVRDVVFAAQLFIYLLYICTLFVLGSVCAPLQEPHNAGRFGVFVQ